MNVDADKLNAFMGKMPVDVGAAISALNSGAVWLIRAQGPRWPQRPVSQ
jgi:hypothetical protein